MLDLCTHFLNRHLKLDQGPRTFADSKLALRQGARGGVHGEGVVKFRTSVDNPLRVEIM